MMRRILLVMAVATLMAAMLAVMAVPAFATIHELSNAECANAEASPVANNQHPPGITSGPVADDAGHDPDKGPFAQPTSVADPEAFKTVAREFYCPAQN